MIGVLSKLFNFFVAMRDFGEGGGGEDVIDFAGPVGVDPTRGGTRFIRLVHSSEGSKDRVIVVLHFIRSEVEVTQYDNGSCSSSHLKVTNIEGEVFKGFFIEGDRLFIMGRV